MEHLRDGDIIRPPEEKQVYKKNFQRIAQKMCDAGIATFSWDKRGYGKTKGSACDYFLQASDAQAALNMLASKKELVDSQKIAVFGQSAGVYVACLLAEKKPPVCAYVLSGGLYSDYKDMMSYNYHRARDYAQKSPENLEWVEKNDLRGMVLGINLDDMFAAVERGETTFTMEYKGRQWTFPLESSVYSPEYAPKNLFKHIDRPALVIHGDTDLNVPVGDAEKIEAELRRNGNCNVKRVIIKNADHSFQETAPDEDTRIRERMSLDSLKRPYIEGYYQEMIVYLQERFAK